MIRQIMQANGNSQKPLWLTEFSTGAGFTEGWLPALGSSAFPFNLGAWFDTEQQDEIWSVFSDNNQYGVYDALEIYAYNDDVLIPPASQYDSLLEPCSYDPTNPSNCLNEYGYSIFRTDGVTPKPAMTWLMNH